MRTRFTRQGHLLPPPPHESDPAVHNTLVDILPQQLASMHSIARLIRRPQEIHNITQLGHFLTYTDAILEQIQKQASNIYHTKLALNIATPQDLAVESYSAAFVPSLNTAVQVMHKKFKVLLRTLDEAVSKLVELTKSLQNSAALNFTLASELEYEGVLETARTKQLLADIEQEACRALARVLNVSIELPSPTSPVKKEVHESTGTGLGLGTFERARKRRRESKDF